MMQESRRRASIKREETRRLLADSRSDVLSLFEYPDLEAIPGLIWDLDGFIKTCGGQDTPSFCDQSSDFKMDTYRRHIQSLLGNHSLRFSDISPLAGDDRRDRVRRFITLIFMDNDLEVEIEQYGNDLLIQRRSNEAYAEG